MRRYPLLYCAAAALGLLIPLGAEAGPYGAGYAPNALSCLTPNQVKTHPITVANTGDINWTTQQPKPFNLSYHWFQGDNKVVWDGLRTSLPTVVGGKNSILKNNVTLNANLQAPNDLGTYSLRWDMVHEGVTWFSKEGVATGDQTVEVKSSCPSSLLQLCTKITCGVFALSPAIEQVVPFISNITPGGHVAVKGLLFGNDPGELWLKGLKRWNGAPHGDVKLGIATEPGKDFWATKSVLGVIPGTITQVKDQPAKLQIKTKMGLWSNEYSVDFRAAKSLVMLKYPDPAVKLIACGTDSNKDVCNGWADPDDGDWFAGFCAQTFYGWHYNVQGAIGVDTGIDTFQITLKNGWELDGGTIHGIGPHSGGSASGVGAVPSNVTSWNPSFNWLVRDSPLWDNSECHGADVWISGPKGVPWK